MNQSEVLLPNSVAPITTIPYEILEIILSYVIVDYRKIRDVAIICRLWNRIITSNLRYKSMIDEMSLRELYYNHHIIKRKILNHLYKIKKFIETTIGSDIKSYVDEEYLSISIDIHHDCLTIYVDRIYVYPRAGSIHCPINDNDIAGIICCDDLRGLIYKLHANKYI